MDNYNKNESVANFFLRLFEEVKQNNSKEAFIKRITDGEFDDALKIVLNRLNNINTPDIPDLISPKETCNLFRPALGRTTLHNYTVKGFLKSYHIGRRCFYSRQEVIQKMKSIKKYGREPP